MKHSTGTREASSLSISDTEAHIELAETYAAHNYHPLRVVLSAGEGAWVTDVEGRRYFDCLAGYSALNFGHAHPRLVARAQEQLGRLTLTSRAFHNDQLGPFARDLAQLTGKEMILPMNSGAEAVETAIKVARKWGYLVKGVPDNQATIVAMEGNFHGRTTTIVSFSTDAVATAHYAPYTPGFRLVPYGDAAALEAAIDESTVAVLLEPIQGEGGVIIPPEGYLQRVRTLCNSAGVLMMADEIQSGLARTGRTFACDHRGVPDVYILGKALGAARPGWVAVLQDRAGAASDVAQHRAQPGWRCVAVRRRSALRGGRPRADRELDTGGEFGTGVSSQIEKRLLVANSGWPKVPEHPISEPGHVGGASTSAPGATIAGPVDVSEAAARDGTGRIRARSQGDSSHDAAGQSRAPPPVASRGGHRPARHGLPDHLAGLGAGPGTTRNRLSALSTPPLPRGGERGQPWGTPTHQGEPHAQSPHPSCPPRRHGARPRRGRAGRFGGRPIRPLRTRPRPAPPITGSSTRSAMSTCCSRIPMARMPASPDGHTCATETSPPWSSDTGQPR